MEIIQLTDSKHPQVKLGDILRTNKNMIHPTHGNIGTYFLVCPTIRMGYVTFNPINDGSYFYIAELSVIDSFEVIGSVALDSNICAKGLASSRDYLLSLSSGVKSHLENIIQAKKLGLTPCLAVPTGENEDLFISYEEGLQINCKTIGNICFALGENGSVDVNFQEIDLGEIIRYNHHNQLTQTQSSILESTYFLAGLKLVGNNNTYGFYRAGLAILNDEGSDNFLSVQKAYTALERAMNVIVQRHKKVITYKLVKPIDNFDAIKN